MRAAPHRWPALLGALVLAGVLLFVLGGDRAAPRLLPPGGPEDAPARHLGLRVPGIAAVDDHRGGGSDAWRDHDPFRAWWARSKGRDGGTGESISSDGESGQPGPGASDPVPVPRWPGLVAEPAQSPRLVAVTETGGVARVTLDLADGSRHRLMAGERAASWRLLAVAAGQAILEDDRGRRLELPLGIAGTTRLALGGGR